MTRNAFAAVSVALLLLVLPAGLTSARGLGASRSAPVMAAGAPHASKTGDELTSWRAPWSSGIHTDPGPAGDTLHASSVAEPAKGEQIAPGTQAEWTIQCVDCPRQFSAMTDRSLQLDAAGHPHIAYGEDHLYHAWHDGADWHYETVDESPDVGLYASLALDGDGHPHISYYDHTRADLKYARWTGSSWSIETVDSEGSVGWHSALAIDGDGHPHISYFDSSNSDLRYAHSTGSDWHIETVDSEGDAGRYTSLVLDGDARPHISYYGGGNLKYARWTGSAWSIETVDSVGSVGMSTSLALDAHGQPHISYLDSTNADLKYTHWTGSAWSVETVDSDGYVGYYTSLALDDDGHPHIGYHRSDYPNTALKYAWWTGSAWIIETVDGTGLVGYYASLALDDGGHPHISYHEWATELKYAHWTGSTWRIETVDREARVGFYTSLALDRGGHPHISYHDYTNRDLKYALWTGSAWVTETVDSEGDVGEYTSLALDAHGHPHISYHDGANYDLKYARWTGSAWHTETVDSEARVGRYTSLAIDRASHPHISYQDGTNGDLKYAHWTGWAWYIETVDSTGYVGYHTSLALDANDHPHIGYQDTNNDDLKYAHWTGSVWDTDTVDGDGDVGDYVSLALDADDYPHISYHSRTAFTLKYAYWTGSSWNIETVDTSSNPGYYTSLALDADDQPHISYRDEYPGADLKYARWTGSVWSIETVDEEGNVGHYTSLALDLSGAPHISYHDYTSGHLKYAVGRRWPDLSASAKMVARDGVRAGDAITYALGLVNSGTLSTTFRLTDPIPPGTTYLPDSVWASGGDINDTHGITWTGTLAGAAVLTATFGVRVNTAVTQPTAIVNVATLTGDPTGPLTLRATVIANGAKLYLPLIRREPPPVPTPTATASPSATHTPTHTQTATATACPGIDLQIESISVEGADSVVVLSMKDLLAMETPPADLRDLIMGRRIGGPNSISRTPAPSLSSSSTLMPAVSAITATATYTPTATATATPTPVPPPHIDDVEPDWFLNTQDTQITVLGSGFQQGTIVRPIGYGLLPATYVNQELLTAIVPAGLLAGRYDLQVINPDGQSCIRRSAFEVAAPTPSPTPVGTPAGYAAVTVRVANRGQEPSTDITWAGFYVDRAPLGEPDVQHFIPALEPGESSDLHVTLPVARAGQHSVVVWLDWVDRIKESNEENNVAIVLFDAPSTPTPMPAPTEAQQISSIDLATETASARIGQAVTVYALVWDQFGHPMAAQTVQFSIAEGRGSVHPTTVDTDSQGQALTELTSDVVGSVRVRAAADGISNFIWVQFTE